MHSSLTILLPTYNRPQRLHRALSYWCQSDWEVIVADGSELSNDVIAGEFKVSKYLWDNKSSLVDRWISAINQVESEFLLICADDDFVGFDAIESCVSFLEKNQDYSCAQGCCLGFNRQGPVFEDIFGRVDLLPLIDDCGALRICNSLRYYVSALYSVQRTQNTVAFLKGFGGYTNDNAFELIFTLGNNLFGKHKILPILYGVRESIPGSAGCVNPSLASWRENDSKSFGEWRSFCIDKIIEIAKIDSSKAPALFDQAFQGYEEFCKNPYCLDMKVGKDIKSRARRLAKSFLKPILPNRFFSSIKQAFESPAKVETDLVSFADRLFGSGSVADALRIQNCIIN